MPCVDERGAARLHAHKSEYKCVVVSKKKTFFFGKIFFGINFFSSNDNIFILFFQVLPCLTEWLKVIKWYQVDPGFILKGSGNSATQKLLVPNEGEELSRGYKILKGQYNLNCSYTDYLIALF